MKMVALTRCTRCATALHFDEEKKDWRNSKDRPVCPQGGPHKVFTPKTKWEDWENTLDTWHNE